MSQGTPAGEAEPHALFSDNVYAALVERFESKQDVANKRSHERKPWATSLTVWLPDEADGTVVEREYCVVTHDISQGGLCFFFPISVSVGTAIRIRFDVLPDHPTAVGTVANCLFVGGKQLRVGVRFESSASASTAATI